MSCNYADGLSPYENKGKLGLPETLDGPDVAAEKIGQLADWIRHSKHIVVHTGAGVSTAAGIPDFRGPKGVWTLERQGKKPEVSVNWDEAVPTATHRAIVALAEAGKINFVISQNIDGLHMRSGLARRCLAELHGNMFIDQCGVCKRQFVRHAPAPTVGQKESNAPCPAPRPNGRPCRGRLSDFVLDWEHELPDSDLDLSEAHSRLADLSIVLGSTLQIVPSGNLPTFAKKNDSGRLVIVNLQPTKHDKKADLIIRDYVDNVLVSLCKLLELSIPEYCSTSDPTRKAASNLVEWTQNAAEAKRMVKLAEAARPTPKRKRKAGEEIAVKEDSLDDKQCLCKESAIVKSDLIKQEDLLEAKNSIITDTDSRPSNQEDLVEVK